MKAIISIIMASKGNICMVDARNTPNGQSSRHVNSRQQKCVCVFPAKAFSEVR